MQEKNIEQQQQQQQQEQKPQYQYVRTPADWDMLSEMLFGSVGMAHKVASIKIHYVKSPPQIMLSRVFCLPSLKDAATVSLDRGMENHLEMQRSNAVSSRRKANTMPGKLCVVKIKSPVYWKSIVMFLFLSFIKLCVVLSMLLYSS
ncbi:uncharacterized protein LOC144748636 [Ciona intestinalis]